MYGKNSYNGTQVSDIIIIRITLGILIYTDTLINETVICLDVPPWKLYNYRIIKYNMKTTIQLQLSLSIFI